MWRRRRDLEKFVLGRQLDFVETPAGEEHLGGVLVHTVDKRRRVVDDLLAVCRLFAFDRDRIRVLGREVVDLFLELGLAVAGGRGDAAVHLLVAFRRPDEGRELRPSHVSQDVHLEQAVLGRGETGTELGVGTCLAENVRNAEFLVTQDHRAFVRRGEGLDPFGLRQIGQEAGVLVVGRADVRRGEVRRDLDQVRIHRLLVSGVRREALTELRLGAVFQVVRTRLPRRDDVKKLPAAAVHERVTDRALLCHTVSLRGAERGLRRERIHQQKTHSQDGHQSRPSDAFPTANNHRAAPPASKAARSTGMRARRTSATQARQMQQAILAKVLRRCQE